MLGIPGADGLVADLGGGSLELARVANNQVQQWASLPLGVLALARAGDAAAIKKMDKIIRAGFGRFAMVEKTG